MTVGEKSFTKTGRMRKATMPEVCSWVIAAWKRVKTSTIINGFRKAGILPSGDGGEGPSTSESDGAGATPDIASESDSDGSHVGSELDRAIMELFDSATDESDFEGFSPDESDQ